MPNNGLKIVEYTAKFRGITPRPGQFPLPKNLVIAVSVIRSGARWKIINPETRATFNAADGKPIIAPSSQNARQIVTEMFEEQTEVWTAYDPYGHAVSFSDAVQSERAETEDIEHRAAAGKETTHLAGLEPPNLKAKRSHTTLCSRNVEPHAIVTTGATCPVCNRLATEKRATEASRKQNK